MKIFQILLICLSSYIFCQAENDSIRTMRLNNEYKIQNDKKRDSLSLEIKKNIHNYDAILAYYHTEYDDFLDKQENYDFYVKLFDKIEKDEKLDPDFYRIVYNTFSLSRGEDLTIEYLERGFKKFPKNLNINKFLETLYSSKFRYAEKDKVKFAQSAIKHLEILNKSKITELEKLQNLIKLHDYYKYLSNNKKVKKIADQIYSKPFSDLEVQKIMSKKDFAKGDRISENLYSRLHYVNNFYDYKKEFKIENNNNSINYFNFLWLRSFFRNVSISIEQRNDGYFLVSKISDEAETISPNTITEKIITKEEFQKFINILSNENLKKITIEDYPGYDGSSWYLESFYKNNKSFRYEWTPKIDCESASSYCSFVNACKYLIKLAEIKTVDKRKMEDEGQYEYDPIEKDGFYLY